jgi:hypothetical protein
MNAITFAELAATEFATSVINEIAKKKKMSGMTISPFIPGLTHDHPPCDFVVDSCAYCMRKGNIFSEEHTEDYTCKDTGDIICKYRSKIVEILEEMEKEIIQITDTTMDHINDDSDDDLEKMLMEELGDI